MWAIFHCFALGALVMDHGNEDLKLASWGREMCHFDIKPENSKTAVVAFALSGQILI
jgi:hypothetical protein